MEKLLKSKIKVIRRHYIAGTLSGTLLSSEIHVCRNSITKYVKLFKKIERDFPNKLTDLNFYPSVLFNKPPQSAKVQELIGFLPQLVMRATTKKLEHAPLWKDYITLYPDGCRFSTFIRYFIKWRRENKICLYSHRRVLILPEEDKRILQDWKANGSHRQWRKAVIILGSYQQALLDDLAAQVETNVKVAQEWIDNYKGTGITGLKRKERDFTDAKMIVKDKQDKLMKIVHQAPMLFDINRTTWWIEDLVIVYRLTYKSTISKSLVWLYLRQQGFVFRSAKSTLTSPDKKYRQKLEKIQDVLRILSPNEKFFSIDEMGPFGIRVREGSSFMHPDNPVTIPAYQKSSGYLICTAALELSTNQVTHFYSITKNTDEMIRLINVLLNQYKDQRKLFLSWDAAGWHSSKKLNEFLAEINTETYRSTHLTPGVELIPLPVSAQFLNVIESVFCGLARSVLHNSNYENEAACKKAIDRHFLERNEHFLKNPKRAGNKIWGEERVRPVFDPVNNCKDPGLR